MAKKVLLIDDDETFTMVLKDVLTQAGLDVVVAGSGEEGIKKAKSEHPSLILLDVKMPGMSGITYLLELRREKSLDGVPVLVSSDMSSFDKLAEREDLGVRGFLLKSETSSEEFVSRIKEELDK